MKRVWWLAMALVLAAVPAAGAEKVKESGPPPWMRYAKTTVSHVGTWATKKAEVLSWGDSAWVDSLEKTGKNLGKMSKAGSYGSWAGAATAAWYGDWVGVAQDTTNNLLSTLATGLGAAIGAAGATAIAIPLGPVGGLAGALAGGELYSRYVKPHVDDFFNGLADTKSDVDAAALALAHARKLMAEAKRNCDAGGYSIYHGDTVLDALAARGHPEDAVRSQVEAALATCAAAAASAEPRVVAQGAVDAAGAAQAAAAAGAGYRDESCRMLAQIRAVSQTDARRIWSSTGGYLQSRTRSVGDDALAARDRSSEASARVSEINSLRRRSQKQAASALAALDAVPADDSGLVEADRFGSEASRLIGRCDELRTRAFDVMQPYTDHLEGYRRIVDAEFVPYVPPLDRVNKLESRLSSARAEAKSRSSLLASWRQRLSTCHSAAPPDAEAESRGQSAASQAGESASSAAANASAAARCSTEAERIASGSSSPAGSAGEGGRTTAVGGEATTPAAGGDAESWVAEGGVETVSGGKPPSSPSPGAASSGPDVNGWIWAAEDSFRHCRFAAALLYAQRLQQAVPDHPWLGANLDRISALARSQNQALSLLEGAQRASAQGDYKAALTALHDAAAVAPSCMSQAIGDSLTRLGGDLQRAQDARSAKNREAASRLVGILIGTYNAAAAATGLSERPPAANQESPNVGGTGRSTSGASSGSRCFIETFHLGEGAYFLVLQPGRGQPDGYLAVSVPPHIDGQCSSGVECMKSMVPGFTETGCKVLAPYPNLAAAEAAAARLCPNPVYRN